MKRNETQPIIAQTRERKNSLPEISIIITAFNQEKLIKSVLTSLTESITLTSEIIIINDGSEDNTLNEIKKFWELNFERLQIITSVRLFSYTHSAFETACDDFGIRNSKTNSIILIQADVLITERGFDSLLTSALTSSNDIIMISGRGTQAIMPIAQHYKTEPGSIINFGKLTTACIKTIPTPEINNIAASLLTLLTKTEKYISSKVKIIKNLTRSAQQNPSAELNCPTPYPEKETFINNKNAGFIIDNESPPPPKSTNTRTIWISQTVMRGPLCIDREKYLKTGGFDTESFFLGYDDHDLALRAFKEFKYRSGFTPIGYKSHPAWGSTRKTRSFNQTKGAIINTIRIQKKARKSALANATHNKSEASAPPEIRTF